MVGDPFGRLHGRLGAPDILALEPKRRASRGKLTAGQTD